MKTAYFLTGSYNNQDNDFELKITIADNPGNDSQYTFELTDISSENKLVWRDEHSTFLAGLNAMDEFIIENNITLYSKILTSPVRDTAADKELEGFILNRLEY